jgi:sugar phosphate isomerase/epimerase
MNRQTASRVLAAGLLLAAVCRAAGEEAPAPKRAAPALFALCMDTHDSRKRTLGEQAALLKELGYDGAGHLWLDNVPERLRTLDAAGLRLFQIYVNVNIAPGKPPHDARLADVLPLLKGRGTMLALLVNGLPPSDPAGDARAAEVIGRIADMARAQDVHVALYPHAGFWLARVADALRVAKKIDRPNVGVLFNLCHWLKENDEKNLRPLLASAMPHLLAVTLHGADKAEEVCAGKGNWIQPLGDGSFDVAGLLRMLKDLGYAGPVGLQCYGLGGDARDHLARSMAEWRRLCGSLYGPP